MSNVEIPTDNDIVSIKSWSQLSEITRGRYKGFLCKWLFHNAPSELLDWAARTAKYITYVPETVLLREGMRDEKILVLLKGYVENIRSDECSPPNITYLAFHIPGEIVGEVSTLLAGPQRATVRTLNKVTVAQFTHHQYRSLAEKWPRAHESLARGIAHKVRVSARQHEINQQTLLITKVKRALLMIEERQRELRNQPSLPDGKIEVDCSKIPLGKDHLARIVAANPDSVTQMLIELKKRKAIEYWRENPSYVVFRVIDRDELLKIDPPPIRTGRPRKNKQDG